MSANDRAQRVQAAVNEARESGRLPAVAAAFVTIDGPPVKAVDGIRKVGEPALATTADSWHLASNTKAFTAALVAHWVDAGAGDYSTLAAPSLGIRPDPSHAQTTVADLLDMTANLSANMPVPWPFYQLRAASDPARRKIVAAEALSRQARDSIGLPFHYSNVSYVVLGALCELWSGQPFEEGLEEFVLNPVGIKRPGYGPNPPGQPWPHRHGRPARFELLDNPSVMTSAGRLRLTLDDWALWIQAVMRAMKGEPGSLPASYGQRLRDALVGTYCNGWVKAERPWSTGPVFNHSGSNLLNYSLAWVVPAEGFAVLAVANQGGPEAAKALDQLILRLVT